MKNQEPLSMHQLLKDPIFVFLLLAPLPFWVWIYATQGVTGITDLSLLMSLVVFYPYVEEIVFRGLIQPFLAKRLSQQWSVFSLANMLTSLLFVTVHLINHPPLWALAVLVPSLVFGYSQERCNHLAAPIILHCTYNAGYFLLLG
ncbi:JDVT-CTERM system glutamic-type intramembrane protease [Porticoccaceae bacterium]|nr:JDVT-CTERM system glutamic-type intramembrane protease [Porticoccaceae bacterium]